MTNNMLQIELMEIIQNNPGILQKDLIKSGTSHKTLMILLKESKIRREWSGYGYKLYLTDSIKMKIIEYIKTHVTGCTSCKGLTHDIHGEKFQKMFNKCFGLKELP